MLVLSARRPFRSPLGAGSTDRGAQLLIGEQRLLKRCQVVHHCTEALLLAPNSFPPRWHAVCNDITRGEHMSYTPTTKMHTAQRATQQEKLRMARAALARVEAKYARKPLKRREEQHGKLRAGNAH